MFSPLRRQSANQTFDPRCRHANLSGERLTAHDAARGAGNSCQSLFGCREASSVRYWGCAESRPYWDLPPLRTGSHGPAIFVWDSGVKAAPLSDVPPNVGPDPHDTVPALVGGLLEPDECLFHDRSRDEPLWQSRVPSSDSEVIKGHRWESGSPTSVTRKCRFIPRKFVLFGLAMLIQRW